MIVAWRYVLGRLLNMSLHLTGKSSETDQACLTKAPVRSIAASRYILTISKLDFSSLSLHLFLLDFKICEVVKGRLREQRSHWKVSVFHYNCSIMIF